MTQEQITTYVLYVAVLVIGFIGEYFGKLPSGTLNSVFLLVVGHVFGTAPIVASAVQAIRRSRNVANIDASGRNVPKEPTSFPPA